jgi:hypothetical protein
MENDTITKIIWTMSETIVNTELRPKVDSSMALKIIEVMAINAKV